MSDPVHVLVVRAAGLPWALPMDSVEQTFGMHGRRIHDVAGVPLLIFRGQSLELLDLASALGQPCDGEPPEAAVIVWAGGRRHAFSVQALVGQLVLERSPLPSFVRSRFCSGAVIDASDEIIPVLEPGVVAGAWDAAGDRSFGFSEIQQSALLEIANIGSGNAATALSQMLGKPVEVHYAEALLATLAEAADRAGASASQSAVVDTPVAGGGKVLLLFPDGAGDQLCELFGTSLDDEMGRSTLSEVGNILASSYLNAIVEMTGMQLEPEPPTIEIDLLGNLVQKSLRGIARPTDPDRADPLLHDGRVLGRQVRIPVRAAPRCRAHAARPPGGGQREGRLSRGETVGAGSVPAPTNVSR
jgi:chemotaxis protein CheC